MGVGSPEQHLRQDALIVAEFDRAFAALPGHGVIDRWWRWGWFGNREFLGSSLRFRFDWLGMTVDLETGPLSIEARLYGSVGGIERDDLGECFGPDPATLASVCAGRVGEWLHGLRSTPGLAPPTEEPSDGPTVEWPEPLPSMADAQQQSTQHRRLRGPSAGTATVELVDAVLDEQLPHRRASRRRRGP